MANVLIHYCYHCPRHWTGVWFLVGALAGQNAWALGQGDVYSAAAHSGDSTYPTQAYLDSIWALRIPNQQFTFGMQPEDSRYFSYGYYTNSQNQVVGGWFEVTFASWFQYAAYLEDNGIDQGWVLPGSGLDGVLPASGFQGVVASAPPAVGPRLQIPASSYAVSSTLSAFIRGLFQVAGTFLGFAVAASIVFVVAQNVLKWLNTSLSSEDKEYPWYGKEVASMREKEFSIRDEAEEMNRHHGEKDPHGNYYDAGRDRLV